MKVIGSMIRPMVMECTCMSMEPGMKASGKMIYKMVKVKRHGMTGLIMKENINRERNRDGVYINGMMGQGMKVSGKKIRLKD